MSDPARIIAYRDSMAALSALIDSMEADVPPSEVAVFMDFKAEFDLAFESADALATDAGVATPPAEALPQDVAAFYTHLIAKGTIYKTILDSALSLPSHEPALIHHVDQIPLATLSH